MALFSIIYNPSETARSSGNPFNPIPPCGCGSRSAGTRLATSYAENRHKYTPKKRICQKGPCFAAWSVFGTFLGAGLLIGLASCYDEEEKKRMVKMEHTSVVDLYVRGIRISRKLPQDSYLYRLPAVRCLQEPNELTLRKRSGRTCPGHSLFTYDLLLLPILLSGCVFCGVFPRNRSGQPASAGHYDSYFHPRRSLLSADWPAAAGCNRNCPGIGWIAVASLHTLFFLHFRRRQNFRE